MQRKQVLLGMSGGVDSSVTAVLLKNQGYQVLGCHFLFSDPLPAEKPRQPKKKKAATPIRSAAEFFAKANEAEAPVEPVVFRSSCNQRLSPEEVQKLCGQFDIPFYGVDLREEFQAVIEDFYVHEALQHRKPFLCHRCNNDLIIRHLLLKAQELACEWIATGHYAQVAYDSSSQLYQLRRAVDQQRDQTHLLSGLNQKTLSKLLLPLGGLSQGMVRKLSEEFRFTSSDRKRDDQNTGCFHAHPDAVDYIESKTSPSLRTNGMVRTVDGEVVGDHEGLHQYRLGQVEGVDINMVDPNDPMCVVGFEPKAQVLIVGREPDLLKSQLMISEVNWILPLNELKQQRCKMRLLPSAQEAQAVLTFFENQTVHVLLEKPVRAVSPGERAIFYDQDAVIGGGTVERCE